MLYKKYIRQRIQIPLNQVAQELGIEASYLSRFMGEGSTHFSEELLYRLCILLRFTQVEIDHIWLLRDYDRCAFPERRRHLEARIRAERLDRWIPELGRLRNQLQQLVDLVNFPDSQS